MIRSTLSATKARNIPPINRGGMLRCATLRMWRPCCATWPTSACCSMLRGVLQGILQHVAEVSFGLIDEERRRGV